MESFIIHMQGSRTISQPIKSLYMQRMTGAEYSKSSLMRVPAPSSRLVAASLMLTLSELYRQHYSCSFGIHDLAEGRLHNVLGNIFSGFLATTLPEPRKRPRQSIHPSVSTKSRLGLWEVKQYFMETCATQVRSIKLINP